MGRLPRHLILLSAVLGLTGCILFTDPINGAPVVTIHAPTDAVARGAAASFRASVRDEDSESSFELKWATLKPGSLGCGAIKWSDIPPDSERRSIDAGFSFVLSDVDPVCVCALATDHHGAPGVGCARVEPVVAMPEVAIVDKSSPPFGSGVARPLCSPVHLSTEWEAPAGDTAEYAWKVTDPSGVSLQPSKCTTSDATAVPERHCCFVAPTQGRYVVSLSVKDTYRLNPGTSKGTVVGNAKDFEVVVSPDQSPCLQSTEPGLFAKLVVLSRDSDTTSDESRTFTVDSVADDCQPYPATSTSRTPSQLVWSIYDGTSTTPSWKTLINSANSLKISQSSFPNARPGDSIKVRVEARDALVQKLYQSGGTVCPPETEICEPPNRSGCVAWTTWTVQFQP